MTATTAAASPAAAVPAAAPSDRVWSAVANGAPLAPALRSAAAEVLSPMIVDFIEGGAGDASTGAELGVDRAVAALRAVQLAPRVLASVARPDTGLTLAGTRVTAPVVVAPMAGHRMAHPDGEVATAAAGRDAGIPVVLSLLASRTWADIGATGATWWLQAYLLRNKRLLTDQLHRARDSGASALVITVDTPVMGRRPRDVRNHLSLPPEAAPINLPPDPDRDPALDADRDPDRDADRDVGPSARDQSPLAARTARQFDPTVTWDYLQELIETNPIPVWLKGILNPADAAEARRRGAAGVWVSAHGGRQFARALTPVQALPAVRAAVGPGYPLIADGGVSSGEDLLTLLALGATAAGVGRTALWALAAGGPALLTAVLTRLTEELRTALLLTGCATVAAAATLRTVSAFPPLPIAPDHVVATTERGV